MAMIKRGSLLPRLLCVLRVGEETKKVIALRSRLCKSRYADVPCPSTCENIHEFVGGPDLYLEFKPCRLDKYFCTSHGFVFPCISLCGLREKKRTLPPSKENHLENSSALKIAPRQWWIQKPYKNKETISSTEIFPLCPPFLSAKRSPSLEQGGVWFLFLGDCNDFLAYGNLDEFFKNATKLGPKNNMTAANVTEFCRFSSSRKSGWRKIQQIQWRRRPENCRFLCLAVGVKHVLPKLFLFSVLREPSNGKKRTAKVVLVQGFRGTQQWQKAKTAKKCQNGPMQDSFQGSFRGKCFRSIPGKNGGKTVPKSRGASNSRISGDGKGKPAANLGRTPP